jgi:hypothetical protein
MLCSTDCVSISLRVQVGDHSLSVPGSQARHPVCRPWFFLSSPATSSWPPSSRDLTPPREPFVSFDSMAPPASSNVVFQTKRAISWQLTKIMNMRDLSKDNDFLSHLLVEKLGTGADPLLVHKMNLSRRLPKTNADDLLQIVRRVSIISLCLFTYLGDWCALLMWFSVF